MTYAVFDRETGKTTIYDSAPEPGMEIPAPPPPPTPEELDARAERVAAQMLDQDAKMKALGMVMADIIERAFNVDQATARRQVKARFQAYYRQLIE